MIVFTGDWHLHPWKRFSTINKEGFNSRLWEQIEVITSIVNWSNDHGAKYVVIPGDVFHAQGEYLNKDVIRAAYVLIDRIKAEVILLPGNHDIFRGKTVFRHFKEVAHVIIEPTVVPLDGEEWAFIPFCRSSDRFREMLEQVGGAQYLVCHQMFKGTEVGPEQYDFRLKDAFPTKMVEDFRSVLSGHCHKHQFLEPNIWYVGSPLQMDFGDEGDQRGFMFYEKESFNFIPVAGPAFYTVNLQTQEEVDRCVNSYDGSSCLRATCGPAVDTAALLARLGHRIEIFKERQSAIEERVSTRNKSHEEIITAVANLLYPGTGMADAAIKFWKEVNEQ